MKLSTLCIRSVQLGSVVPPQVYLFQCNQISSSSFFFLFCFCFLGWVVGGNEQNSILSGWRTNVLQYLAHDSFRTISRPIKKALNIEHTFEIWYNIYLENIILTFFFFFGNATLIYIIKVQLLLLFEFHNHTSLSLSLILRNVSHLM